MFFFICSCLLKLSIVLHHILAKEFSKGSISQHPNIILHHFMTNTQTCILILLANIQPLYWGNQSCQYMNTSHCHRMVLVRRDLKYYLISPCLHISILIHRGENHQSGEDAYSFNSWGQAEHRSCRWKGGAHLKSVHVFRISFEVS